MKRFMMLGGFHGVIAMGIYRTGNFIYYHLHIPVIKQMLYAIYCIMDYIILRTLLNCEIPAKCKIGKNLYLPHGAKGVIIDRNVVIGNNVTILHQVTLGISFGKEGAPTIEDGVFIGAGAKVIGKIKIGKNAKIGANAVIVKDLADNAKAYVKSTIV